MRYTTKKPLEGVKIWAEDELIDTKNVIVCSTPPKEGEKFTGIGFLIWQNKQLYMVGDDEGKCKVLNKIPEGWRKLDRELDLDLWYTMGRDEKKGYDHYNKYFRFLRRKRMLLNIMELASPREDVPHRARFARKIKEEALSIFNDKLWKMRKENGVDPKEILRRHVANQITYPELVLYNKIINEVHTRKCQEFEDSYDSQKAFYKHFIEWRKQDLKYLLRFEKDDKEIDK